MISCSHPQEVGLKKYLPRFQCALDAAEQAFYLTALIIGFLSSSAFSQSFTMQQALGAPFPVDLVAAPAKGMKRAR